MKKFNRLTALMSAVVFLSSTVLFSCKKADDTTISEPGLVTVTDIQVSNAGTFEAGYELTKNDFVVKKVMSDGTKVKVNAADFSLEIPAANLNAENKLCLSENAEETSEAIVVKITYESFVKSVNIVVEAKGSQAGDEEEDVEYDVSFSAGENTYEAKDGVYTITLNAVQDESSNWGNQIFIANPNEEADIAAGDLIIVKITAEADKEIKSLFVKDQFNGVNYSGIDTAKNIPANTLVDFVIVGTVANDYDATASLVLDVRGNEAGTVLKLSKISVAKLGDYDVTSISLSASSETPAAGETVTFTVKDQYGIALSEGVEYEITSGESESELSGATLSTGTSAETLTVKATYGELESNEITITVSVSKDYNKYFKPEIISEGNAAPKNYFSVWYDHNWCGSTVTLSNLNATEDGFTLTSGMTGFCWFGTQIWYGVEGSNDVSFKITADASGFVTINGVVYEIIAGQNTDVSFTVGDRVGIQLGYEASLVNMGAGYPETSSVLGNGAPVTVTVSNFTVTPKN